MTIVHLFADAKAIDLHFIGAQERAGKAMELMTPEGWEILGPASDAAITAMRREGAAAGMPLITHSEYVTGFLRLATA